MTTAREGEAGPIIRPAPEAWRVSMNADDLARRTRAELGLSTDAPIIMSGHQCELWHPGILAKWLAINAAAAHAGARTAWVEVDQDAGTFECAYPINGPARATWRPGPPTPANVPLACQPAIPASRLTPPSSPFAFAQNGLSAAAHAMANASDRPTLAAQVSSATDALLAWTGPTPRRVFASSLCRTGVFHELIEALSRDPRRSIELHNQAAARFPEAHTRPFRADASRTELPLWRLTPGRPRTPVFSDELAVIPRDQLAPKGLLMTALLRAAACDLFIHGLGGEKYDRITDEWIGSWLGWRLAPTAVVTATRTLPFDVADAPAPTAIAHARWRAHHARHDPEMLGDPARAARKRSLVDGIAASRDPADRLRLYRELRGVVADSVAAAPGRLAEFDARAASLRASHARSAVIFDRTWPFPLYPPGTLHELDAAIRRAFSAGASA